MKVLPAFSLLWLCIHATKKEVEKYICQQPDMGPVCQKIETFYWSDTDKKCKTTQYLTEPCGFFYNEKRCNLVCGNKSLTLEDVEKYVKELP